MCIRGSLFVFFLIGAGPIGCNTASSGTKAEAGERVAGAIKLEAGNPKLAFLTIEEVKPSAGGGSISLTGKVSFDEDHTQRVASPIDGRVTGLLVKVGDHVRTGASLVELSSPHVGQLQSDAQKAISDLGVASSAAERTKKLAADGAVSDKEVAQVESEFRKAKSEVARTSAQLRALGLAAGDPATNVVLRAQVSGTVVERNILTGQEVRSDGAAPLLTISSLSSVWVLADIYEQDLAAVTEGAQVSVHVAAYSDASFSGKVVHVGDVVDATSRTVKIRCLVANPDGRLKPEMFATIEIARPAEHAVLSIPARAIINEGDLSKVVIAGAGNIFRSRVVKIGPEVSGQVRVLAGLQAGERIVTDGALFLKQEIDTN